MTIKVWERETKRIVKQEIHMAKALWFLYHTRIGRFLFRWVFCSGPAAHICGLYMKSPLSTGKIHKFLKIHPVNHEIYEKGMNGYVSFNDFFIRKLRDPHKLVDMDRGRLVSPADSQVLAYDIDEDLIIPVKGSSYTISELLNADPIWENYIDGKCLVFRLAPHNYHRYCYCDNGRQSDVRTIKGKLHSVNPIAVIDKVKIYSQNYRQYAVLNTENFGNIIQIEIGAMLIGKIRNHHMGACDVRKGEEKGLFEYGGSAIIMLIENGCAEIDQDILDNSKTGLETAVRYGERIGSIFIAPH